MLPITEKYSPGIFPSWPSSSLVHLSPSSVSFPRFDLRRHIYYFWVLPCNEVSTMSLDHFCNLLVELNLKITYIGQPADLVFTKGITNNSRLICVRFDFVEKL